MLIILLLFFSVKKSKKEMRKLFGFAFVRITNKDQIVVKDDVHDLCVYKVGTQLNGSSLIVHAGASFENGSLIRISPYTIINRS